MTEDQKRKKCFDERASKKGSKNYDTNKFGKTRRTRICTQ